MKFTIMIIDDEAKKRLTTYTNILENVRIIGNNYSLDPVEISSGARMVEAMFERISRCHLIFLDIFLDTETNRPFTIFEDGKYINVLEKLGQFTSCPPIFITSELWGNDALKYYQTSLVNQYVQGTINLALGEGPTDQCEIPNYELVATQIEAALVRSMGGISLDLSPKENLQILHMSDLHMGANWNEGDSGDPQVWEMKIEAIKREIDFCCSQPKMDFKRPAILIITGDITQTGTMDQFVYAQAFISQLLIKLQIPKHACFICPGNHDVFMPSAAQSLLSFKPPTKTDKNCCVYAKALTNKSKEGIFNLDLTDEQGNFAHERGVNPGLCNFRAFFYAVTGKSEWSIDLQKPQGSGNAYFNSGLFSFHGLNIFGLNTVNELKPGNFISDTELHNVHIGKLVTSLQEAQTQFPENLNILFAHHPIVRNGLNTGVSEGLHGNRNLILFGHRHKRFASLDAADREETGGFLYSCAPSIALKPGDNDKYFEVGFNTITIKRVQGKPNALLIRKHNQHSDNSFQREHHVKQWKID